MIYTNTLRSKMNGGWQPRCAGGEGCVGGGVLLVFPADDLLTLSLPPPRTTNLVALHSFLGLQKQIKDQYRKQALKLHPDKAVSQGMDKDKAEEIFKKLQDAYETLSDPAKRKEFDSMDEFDDYLPSTCTNAADFYKIFGTAFKRQARWSEKKPPLLGDDKEPFARVQAFYDFWFKFKSWRIFPHPDEEDEEQATGRDERRWIQKHNQRLRAGAKKEEGKRIREFVDAAWNADPRVARENDKKKEEREARRLAKQAEKDKRHRSENADAIAAAEAAAAAEAKAKEEIEAEKNRLKEEKKRMREYRASLAKKCRGESLASNEDVSYMCEHFGLSEFMDIAEQLEKIGNDKEEATKALAVSIEAVRARVARGEAAKAAKMEVVEERLANGATAHHDKQVKEMTPWTEEEFRSLEKGMKKYPVGTKNRWEVVAQYVRTRTAEEVIVMVKENLAKGKIPDNLIKEGIVIKEKKKGNLVMTAEADVREQALTDVPLPMQDAAERADLKTQGAAVTVVSEVSGAWTAAQEQALVNAMKTFGNDVADRWERISVAVPVKNKAECMARFKELKDAFKKKEDRPPDGTSEWGPESEQALVKALKTVGKDVEDRWSKVAELVPGHSAAACQTKFKALKAAHSSKKKDAQV